MKRCRPVVPAPRPRGPFPFDQLFPELQAEVMGHVRHFILVHGVACVSRDWHELARAELRRRLRALFPGHPRADTWAELQAAYRALSERMGKVVETQIINGLSSWSGVLYAYSPLRHQVGKHDTATTYFWRLTMYGNARGKMMVLEEDPSRRWRYPRMARAAKNLRSVSGTNTLELQRALRSLIRSTYLDIGLEVTMRGNGFVCGYSTNAEPRACLPGNSQ